MWNNTRPDKMADESSEKTAEVTDNKQETTDTIEKENDESKKENNLNISETNNDSEKQELDGENTVENDCISKESQDAPVENNVPIKTGFLRSFIEKKKVLQSSDVLEVSEDSNGSKTDKTDDTPSNQEETDKATSLCKWQGCNTIIISQSELSQHVHQNHVEPMVVQDVFVCLWQGCKVFNKPSCSHSWLSKHMNSHTGDKPFKCMIDGCSMSFSSCEGLSRHVAGHFSEPKAPKRQRGEQKETPKKNLKKRRTRVLRKRLPPAEVKEDFVDPQTVQSIKKKLPHMMPLSCYEIGIDGTKIILHSKVCLIEWFSYEWEKIYGKRINEKSGETDVLLHWSPDELIPDEWIPIEDYEKHKSRTINISSLPNDVVADLDPAFYRRMSYRKHPRK